MVFVGDQASKVALYVAVPTAEFRTTHGHIAHLIGNVLQLCHQRNQTAGTGNSARASFTPLFHGASAHSAVFGYWTELAGKGRRIDDHSEIIEFYISPKDYAPAFLMIIMEIVFPSLYIARQHEILAVTSHENIDAKLRVARVKETTASLPSSPGNITVSSTAQIDPIACLGELITTFLWLENASGNGSVTNKPSIDKFLEELQQWFSDHGDIVPLSSNSVPQVWTMKYHTNWMYKSRIEEWGHGSYNINLPIIYIRLIVDTMVWWIFLGLSSLIVLSDRNTPRSESEKPQLWTEQMRTEVVRLLDQILNRLEGEWLPADGNGYFTITGTGAESPDPMANAILWLAFVRDFIHKCITIVPEKKARGEKKITLDKLYLRGEPFETLLSLPEDPVQQTEAVPFPPYDLRFAHFAQRMHISVDNELLTTSRPERKSYWQGCLRVLDRINDEKFPDDYLVEGWQFLLRQIKESQIEMGSPLKLLNSPNKLCPDLNLGFDLTTHWWVETGRRWRSLSPIARSWLAPFLLENIFLSGSVRRSNRRFTTLDAFFEYQRGGTVSGRSLPDRDMELIRSLSRDTIFAFPLHFSSPVGINEIPLANFVKFIDALQKEAEGGT